MIYVSCKVSNYKTVYTVTCAHIREVYDDLGPCVEWKAAKRLADKFGWQIKQLSLNTFEVVQ